MSQFEVPRRVALKAGAGLVSVAAAGLPAAETWTPQTLDAHQMATVEVLGELIIPTTDTPGAKAALVHRYVDLFLSDGPEPEKIRFLNGLGWLDGYTNRKYQKTFLKLSSADQLRVLQTLDTDSEYGIDEGHSFFAMLKSLVSRIYYNTEIGYKELNKGGRVPASYGCATKPSNP